MVVNSDPADLVLYSYDENLVESPDADDYTSFWYGDVGTDDIDGLPKSYENYQIDSDYGKTISSIESLEGLQQLANAGDESAISAIGSRSLTDLVQNVLLNNQETLLELAERSEATTVAPVTATEASGPVIIRFDETNEERGM